MARAPAGKGSRRKSTRLKSVAPTKDEPDANINLGEPGQSNDQAKTVIRLPIQDRSESDPLSPVPGSDPGHAEQSPQLSSGKRKADADTTLVESPVAPSSKRQKHNLPPARKHSDYWYLDGNVVIQVEDVQFKLHRSQLVRHSSYFANLFESDAGKAVGNVDGYPLYHISNVSLVDFELLVSSLEDAIMYTFEQPHFSTIASILRASSELSFPKFRDWAIKSFQYMWSDDLDDVTTTRIRYATETVALASKYDVPGVMRRAFYELLRTGGFGQGDVEASQADKTAEEEEVEASGADGEGIDDEDVDNEEEVDESPPEDGTETNTSPTPSPWSSLSLYDTRILITTREKLISQWLITAASAPTNFACPLRRTSTSTDATQRCIGLNSKTIPNLVWARLVVESGLLEDYLYDPICGLDALIKVDWAKEGYCPGCINVRKKAWRKMKSKLWENLDLWLEL